MYGDWFEIGHVTCRSKRYNLILQPCRSTSHVTEFKHVHVHDKDHVYFYTRTFLKTLFNIVEAPFKKIVEL